MRGTHSAGAIARLLTVCAVLVGVLLMHSLPEQTCAGGTGDPVAAMAATAAGGDHLVRTGPVSGNDMGAGHGNVCVSTSPSRGLDGLLAMLLLAVVALGVSARFPPYLSGHRSRHGRRKSPRAGPDLLTVLCVSRT